MKILMSIFLIFAMCLMSQLVYAASVGLAPENLFDVHKVSMGIEYDAVLERELKTEDDEVYKSNAVLVNAAYGLTENYFLYGKLGISDLKFKHTAVSGSDRAEYKIEYDYGPAWAIGTRAAYKIGDALRMDFDVQYFGATGDVNDMTVADTKATGLSTDRYLLTELSASAILGYDLFCYDARFTPYTGVRLSRYHLDIGSLNHSGVTVGSTQFLGISGSENAEHSIGIIAGMNVKFEDSYYLNLESRFVDETAMSVAFIYGF